MKMRLTMLAMIHALLRLFGFGGTAAEPLRTKKIPLSPVMALLRDQARAEGPGPDPTEMTVTEAVDVFARHSGQRPANEAPPPDWKAKLAIAIIPPVVLLYLRALEALGRSFPRPRDNDKGFERRLMQLALTDVRTWLLAIFSGKPVTIPPHITRVLIRRAARLMGLRQPLVMAEGHAPDFFFAEAELEMCVIEIATGFVVFPRVIGRGDADLIEVADTDRRFHRDTVTRSGWDFRLGFAGQVFEPPEVPDAGADADKAVADLTPKGSQK
jgi:hypothetical protein